MQSTVRAYVTRLGTNTFPVRESTAIRPNQTKSRGERPRSQQATTQVTIRVTGCRSLGYAPGVPTIEWLDEEDHFGSLAEEWDRLLPPDRPPFLHHAWFACWWRAYGEGSLAVATAREDGRLVGVLPLRRTRHGLASLSNRHTQVFRVMAETEEVSLALLRAASSHPGETFELSPIAAADPALPALLEASAAAGRLAFTEPLRTSPIVFLEADFPTYLAALGSSTRKGLRRARRLLEAEHAVTFRRVAAPDDLDGEIARLLALEAAGWKGRDGTAMLSQPETASFFRDIADAFHRLGLVRISTLTCDGTLAASELAILTGNTLWSLKGAYEESLGRFSPGRVLLLSVIERCFELGLDAIELLGADEPYKLAVANGARPMVVFRSYARTPRGVGRYAYRRSVRPRAKDAYLRFGGLRARMAVQRALVRIRR